MKQLPTTLSIVLATTLLLLFFHLSESFLLLLPASNRSLGGRGVCTGILYAKNTNKKRRRGGQQQRNKVAKNNNEKTDLVPNPSRFRKHTIELDRRCPTSHPLLRVCTVEVNDKEWWEHPGNHNPYGGKLWPSALAISEFLAAGNDLRGHDVLELGCGAGLVSIVAATLGARVIASDVSPIARDLCRTGWLETQKLQQQQQQRQRPPRSSSSQSRQQDHQEKEEEDEIDDATNDAIKPGSLDTIDLDLFSEKPLPMASSKKSASAKNQKIVVATAMMYEARLAKALARRAFEACARCGAWVMIGDDDTGEREGGRRLFVSELDRLEKTNRAKFRRTWTSSVVENKTLKWNAKQAKILHLNAPEDVLLDGLLRDKEELVSDTFC